MLITSRFCTKYIITKLSVPYAGIPLRHRPISELGTAGRIYAVPFF